MEKLRKYIFEQHDVVCNQKYGDNLPYSFHLKAVEAQGEKFIHLIEDKIIRNENNYFSEGVNLRNVIRYSLAFHDSLEDARVTYNDILKLEFGNSVITKMIADIVYCVTDEKGKNRSERKNAKYYKELKENKLAVFVKLADIAANTLYSKLTGSSMYDKYKKEFPSFRDKLYLEEYKEFFDYVESL